MTSPCTVCGKKFKKLTTVKLTQQCWTQCGYEISQPRPVEWDVCTKCLPLMPQKNFQWSADTAGNYMRVHALSQTPEFRRLRNLPLEALYLLGRKSVTADFRAEVVERIEAGEAVTARTLTIPVTRSSVTVTSVGYLQSPEEPPAGIPEPEPEVGKLLKLVPKTTPRVARHLVEHDVDGDELERLRVRVAELEDQVRRLESENAELRAQLPQDDPFDIPPLLRRHLNFGGRSCD